MSNPRLVWNSNTIDFPGLPSDWVLRRDSKRAFEYSDGKISATALKSLPFRGRILMDRFHDADFEAALHAFWAWAVQGKQFSIARDAAQMYEAVTTAQVNPGGTVIVVASTTGLSASQWIYLMHTTQPDILKAKIASLTATDITITGYPAKYTFPTGSIVRHVDYLPKAVIPGADAPFPIEENPSIAWTLNLPFLEDAA